MIFCHRWCCNPDPLFLEEKVQIEVLSALSAERLTKGKSSVSLRQFSPYGFPRILEAPLSQATANRPPNSPVLPAETLSVAAPSADVPQPVQQQQVSGLSS